MLKIVLSRTTVGNPLERLLAFQFPVCGSFVYGVLKAPMAMASCALSRLS